MFNIYRVRCLANQKVYIGCTTVSLEKRWKHHVSDSHRYDTKFYRAIRKYGPNRFIVEFLKVTDSEESMFKSEREYISKYDSVLNGYNSTLGGDGGASIPEIHQKISRALSGRSRSPEWRQKISASMIGKNKGRILSNETKKKMSISHIGLNVRTGNRTNDVL